MTLRRLASFFFLATVFCCTFEKVHWSFGGAVSLADDRRRQSDQCLRRGRGRQGLSTERPHGRPEPPRDHADRPTARPDAALPPARARAPAALATRPADRLPLRSRACNALTQRAA